MIVFQVAADPVGAGLLDSLRAGRASAGFLIRKEHAGPTRLTVAV
jgi:hypothetical protein